VIVPIRTGSELGPEALKVKDIHELNLVISFDVAASVTPGEPIRYDVSVKRETDSNPRPIKKTVNLGTGMRNDQFELLSVVGATNEPTALIIKLTGEFDPITISKDKPYSRPIGYAADLVYPPGKQTFNNKRPKDQLKLEGDPETYKIVAISRNEVVLSADSNKRRTVIKYNANSTTASNTIPYAPPR